MFDSVVLRQQSVGPNPIDVGFLAESLLFYSKVHVAGHHSMLKQLISVCTPEVLIELFELGSLEITYETTQFGMFSPNKNARDHA